MIDYDEDGDGDDDETAVFEPVRLKDIWSTDRTAALNWTLRQSSFHATWSKESSFR